MNTELSALRGNEHRVICFTGFLTKGRKPSSRMKEIHEYEFFTD
jgi:hypothetical protein